MYFNNCIMSTLKYEDLPDFSSVERSFIKDHKINLDDTDDFICDVATYREYRKKFKRFLVDFNYSKYDASKIFDSILLILKFWIESCGGRVNITDEELFMYLHPRHIPFNLGNPKDESSQFNNHIHLILCNESYENLKAVPIISFKIKILNNSFLIDST